MNREAVLIREYIDECLPNEPGRYWPPYYFKKSSYSRWIANEILETVELLDDSHSIMSVVRSYYDKMDDFSELDPKTKEIFEIARETAGDILDMLRAAK